MKPHIGLDADFVDARRSYHKLYAEYTDAVSAAGGVPVVIPNLTDEEDILSMLSALDGLVLTGGYDLNPQSYHQEPHPSTEVMTVRRQKADARLAELALVMEIPILGICLGCQLINVALGGTLIQDIPSETTSTVKHAPDNDDDKAIHKVRVEQGSRLFSIAKEPFIDVDSSHHQAIKSLGRNLVVSAWGDDDVIEAIEIPGRWVLGVQWHPERSIDSSPHKALFEALVAASVA
jgi:putative glutamine amidotransferase